jgi:hypothetical protein
MRRPVIALIALLAVLSGMAALPGAAGAQAAGGRPTAVVTLGDSYISGEAGRWEGNSSSDRRDRRGTDRAAYRNRWGWWRYDPSRVYGASDNTGCHRSDVAPVLSSGIPVDRLINLACSGAATRNLLRASSGGVGMKGEAPQGDQLAEVAATHDVEMIVVSIGGNDLGFSSTIIDCALDYLFSRSSRPDTCHEEQQAAADARMAGAMEAVGAVLADIEATMVAAGQGEGEYRLVLQSYPSPVPSGDEFRYPQSGWRRILTGGCPFWNVDATWARDTFVPRLSAELAAVAAGHGAEFLDLQDALDGREVCAETTAQSDGPDAAWARFLSTGILQGEVQESLHPNAYGQQANGTCLGLLFAAGPGDYRCANEPGSGPDAMVLGGI